MTNPCTRTDTTAACELPLRKGETTRADSNVSVRFISQKLIHQFLFDLLQRFAFSFRQLEFDENETGHANRSIKPERSSRTKRRVQNRKCVSQQETGNPQGGD